MNIVIYFVFMSLALPGIFPPCLHTAGLVEAALHPTIDSPENTDILNIDAKDGKQIVEEPWKNFPYLAAFERKEIHHHSNKIEVGNDKTADRETEGQKAGKLQGSSAVPLAFLNRKELLKTTKTTSLGTIAYVEQENMFFGRGVGGWSQIFTGDPVPVIQYIDRFKWSANNSPLPRVSKPQRQRSLTGESLGEQRALRLVALNNAWTGNLGSVHYINYRCQREATIAGIHGFFRAFMSSRDKALHSIISVMDDLRPIANLKGEILFDSFLDLFKRRGKLDVKDQIPSIFSFNGKNVIEDDSWPENQMWHGTDTDKMGENENCLEWTSSSGSHLGSSADFLFLGLLNQQEVPCSSKLMVFCIEIGIRQKTSSSHQPYLTFSDYTKLLDEYDHFYGEDIAQDYESDEMYPQVSDESE